MHCMLNPDCPDCLGCPDSLGCFTCNSGVTLSPANKNLFKACVHYFISNFLFFTK